LQLWFQPEQPGQLVGPHVITTGKGAAWVGHWPEPRALLVESAGNYTLVGQPEAISPVRLALLVVGFVDAAAPFAPLLHATFPNLRIWNRVVYVLDHHQPEMSQHNALIRRLHAGDTAHVAQLSPDLAWIAKTWGGPAGLARSGYAWGAFVQGQLAAVACSFFVGSQFEEIGVITESAYRGQGLSVACAAALCQDVQQRGRQASWSTSPDNRASIRVAEKLGFRFARDHRLYVCGIAIPTPPRPPA
jgi:RimJ/RimL family protein N-acetyltransferase